MKTLIITAYILLNSLSNFAQDSTGKFSIKLTGAQIDYICQLIDSSALPAKIANAFKADIIGQARKQIVPPTKKEGKKE